jgi:hypothetical protein
MKVRILKLGIVLVGFTLAAAPALAQGPKEGGGPAGGGASDRSGGGGAATSSGSGAAGSAGGGGVAMGGGGSGGGSSSSGGASFSSPSGNAATASNLSFGDRGVRESAPQRRAGFNSGSRTASANGAPNDSQDSQKATPRTAGSSGSGERAVPRGTSSSGGDSNSGASNAGNTRERARPTGDGGANNAAGAREIPTWSRPRGDRPVTGVAVDRVGPPPDRNGGNRGGGRYYYDPFYYGGYGGGYPSFGYGYGYYPYSFGMGYGLYSGLGWNPYYGDPFDPYYAGTGGYSSGVYNTREQGSLKLKVKPRTAKVYVDGYFVGLVDEFDGAFQKLALNGGRHKVEVRAEGFETAEFDVLITPDQTITFQGELKRIQ